MSATYTDPATDAQDMLRFLVGDVDMSQPLLQDEEYEALRFLWPDTINPYELASYCAEAIAAKFAREIDFTADSQSVGANVLQEKYLSLAMNLRTRANGTYPGVVYVGGIDPWVSFDPTVAPPAFGTGMHDNPAAGNQDQGDLNPGLSRWWEH